jgi:beta-glucanase (GH16 family)
MVRRLICATIAVACVLECPSSAHSGDRLDRAHLGRLTFADEFDGRPLSFYNPKTGKGVWKTNFFYGDQAGASSRTTQGASVFVDKAYAGIDPFGLRDDQVHLTLQRVSRTNDPKFGGAKYTAGMLSTERSFSQTYGYWEAKIVMPDVPGTWPAFWLWSEPVKDLTGKQWGGEWPGGLDDEIDIVEGQGVRPGKTLHTALKRYNWKGPVGGERVEFKKVESRLATISTTNSARAYGLLWTAEELIWFVDDAEVFRCKNIGWHSPMYVILSMGAGGWDGNDIRSDFQSAQMHVEHVRVYALPATAERPR